MTKPTANLRYGCQWLVAADDGQRGGSNGIPGGREWPHSLRGYAPDNLQASQGSGSLSTEYLAAMSTGKLDRLSDRQRDCLRMVHANFEAKEIAIALGLSPHTVNEHLRDARRLLGVSRSMQAARMLAAAEGDNRPVSELIGVQRDLTQPDGPGAVRPDIPERIARRSRYKLGSLARICLIVATAVAAVALAGALLVGVDAITRVFRAEQVDISDPPYRQ